jgi:oligopeptidase B
MVTTPKAKIVEHEHSYFGNMIKDNYHWLKDQNSEKKAAIIEYLNVKNRHLF